MNRTLLAVVAAMLLSFPVGNPTDAQLDHMLSGFISPGGPWSSIVAPSGLFEEPELKGESGTRPKPSLLSNPYFDEPRPEWEAPGGRLSSVRRPPLDSRRSGKAWPGR